MRAGKDRRHDERFSIPAVIDAPGLSKIPLLAEDVSAGGIRVVVSRKPDPKAVFECSVQIFNEVFDRCSGKIVWVSDNESTPKTWSVGVMVELIEGDRKHFVRVLKELGKQYQGAIPPFSFP